jgi:hypothetical protein
MRRVGIDGKQESPANGERQVAMNPVAWVVQGELDLADWVAYGRRIGVSGRSSGWWIGDWLRYGNARFGERYSRASKTTGYDPQTLMNMVYVASRYGVERRRENLSWSHHAELAALDQEEQERWLTVAEQERWSLGDLRVACRNSRGKRGAEKVEDKRGDSHGTVPKGYACPRCGYVST